MSHVTYKWVMSPIKESYHICITPRAWASPKNQGEFSHICVRAPVGVRTVAFVFFMVGKGGPGDGQKGGSYKCFLQRAFSIMLEFLFTHTHTHTHTNTPWFAAWRMQKEDTDIHTHTRAHTHARTHARTHTHAHTYTHTHTHTQKYTRTHTSMHTHTHTLRHRTQDFEC